MSTNKISYTIIASGFQDYVRVMLGETEIAYIKTTKENFETIGNILLAVVNFF